MHGNRDTEEHRGGSVMTWSCTESSAAAFKAIKDARRGRYFEGITLFITYRNGMDMGLVLLVRLVEIFPLQIDSLLRVF